MKTFFTLLLCGLVFMQVYAQAGKPDNTFGTNGKVFLSNFGGSSEARAIAVQSDGKIVVAGYSGTPAFNRQFALARFNNDGTLDDTFNGNGKVTTAFGSGSGIESFGNSVAIQSDGKIVVAGSSTAFGGLDFALARYNSNGTLDNAFGGDGRVTTDFSGTNDEILAIVVQSDGKIVAAGYSQSVSNLPLFALARYNSTGALDNTFGVNGRVTTSINVSSTNNAINAIALQSNGRIVVAGYTTTNSSSKFAFARYLSNGTLDNTFDSDGIATIDVAGTTSERATGIALQSDGKIVATGTVASGSNSVIGVVRFNSNGILDNTFSSDGKLTTSLVGKERASDVAVQSDGKIVVAGSSNTDFVLVRYNSNGNLDLTFNSNGIVVGTGIATLDFGGFDQGLAMRLFGNRIYVAGSTDVNTLDPQIAVAAFKNDATPLVPLPLVFTSLSAARQNTSVALTWKTIGDESVSVYEIERSTDALHFSKVGTVDATAHSSSEKTYSYTDNLSMADRLSNTIFYRLKIIEAAKFNYSQTIVVRWDASTRGLKVITNPVGDVLHLQATAVNETIQVSIIDVTGRQLRQEKMQLNNTTSFSIDVHKLPGGKYYVILQTRDGEEIQPFVKH